MKLYEINAALAAAIEVDEETGELLPGCDERLAALELDRTAKICDIACVIEARDAEEAAHRAEARKQAEKARIAANQAEWLRAYLSAHMEPGEKVGDSRKTVRCGESQSVEINEDADIPADYMVPKFAPDKKALKAALEAGVEISGARIVTKKHVVIT
jgi:hypothetical protein